MQLLCTFAISEITLCAFPVSQHFNFPSNLSLKFFTVTGIINCSSQIRQPNIYNLIVFKLGILTLVKLNTKFEAFIIMHNLINGVITFLTFYCVYTKVLCSKCHGITPSALCAMY